MHVCRDEQEASTYVQPSLCRARWNTETLKQSPKSRWQWRTRRGLTWTHGPSSMPSFTNFAELTRVGSGTADVDIAVRPSSTSKRPHARRHPTLTVRPCVISTDCGVLVPVDTVLLRGSIISLVEAPIGYTASTEVPRTALVLPLGKGTKHDSVKAVVELATRCCGWLSPCRACLGSTKVTVVGHRRSTDPALPGGPMELIIKDSCRSMCEVRKYAGCDLTPKLHHSPGSTSKASRSWRCSTRCRRSHIATGTYGHTYFVRPGMWS